MSFGEAKRVVIYRLGSLGDTVVALPAFHLIERAFPDARRLLLTNKPAHAKAPAAAAILEGSGLVHGYIDYPLRTRAKDDAADAENASQLWRAPIVNLCGKLGC